MSKTRKDSSTADIRDRIETLPIWTAPIWTTPIWNAPPLDCADIWTAPPISHWLALACVGGAFYLKVMVLNRNIRKKRRRHMRESFDSKWRRSPNVAVD